MNMNEALQQSLYDKLSREQDKYRDWLKGQPPEEILHHSYEYTVREDILMSMEELTLSEAETRARLLGKLQEPVQPNSPGGTHFMAEVSRDFMERAGAKDTAALQKLLPFSSLALTTLKDRRGVYALIGKDEDRSQPLRSRKPSVRSKLQQTAEQKPTAAKKKDLEL